MFFRALARTCVVNRYRNIMVGNFVLLLEYVKRHEGCFGLSFFATLGSPLPSHFVER